jgi:hypothetical protein
LCAFAPLLLLFGSGGEKKKEADLMAHDYEYVPPSPTLTNPDMILPTGMVATLSKSQSQSQLRENHDPVNTTPTRPNRPPPAAPADDPSMDNKSKRRTSTVPAIGLVQQQLFSDVGTASGDTEAVDELDLTPKRPAQHPVQSFIANNAHPEAALASSPLLRPGMSETPSWPLRSNSYIAAHATQESQADAIRRMSELSIDSSSVHSEDLERWKPKQQTRVNTEGSDEMERNLNRFRTRFGEKSRASAIDESETDGGESDQEAWPTQREGESSEDFLSRRAEIILANAKKKLNVGIRMQRNMDSY